MLWSCREIRAASTHFVKVRGDKARLKEEPDTEIVIMCRHALVCPAHYKLYPRRPKLLYMAWFTMLGP